MSSDDEAEELVYHLGFTEKLDKSTAPFMQPHYFVSKAGGKPAWLVPRRIPGASQLACPTCKEPMTFLLQVYAPIDTQSSAYHRQIVVFSCRKKTCVSDSHTDGFRVFRCQLERNNAFYPFDAPVRPERDDDSGEDDEDGESDGDHQLRDVDEPVHALPNPAPPEAYGEQLCFVCGAAAAKQCGHCHSRRYCTREHQQKHWRVAHRSECAQLSAARAATKGASPGADAAAVAASSDAVGADSLPSSVLEDDAPAPSPSAGGDAPVSPAAGEYDATKYGAYPELEIVTQREPDESAQLPSADEQARLIATYGRYLQANDVAAPAAGEPLPAPPTVKDDFEDEAPTDAHEVDSVFLEFQERISRDPEQVLRYARWKGAGPQWVGKVGQATPQDIPPCPLCNAPRSFEVQVLPQLLYFLQVDTTAHAAHDEADDWGTLVVYTCSRSCTPGVETPYVQEVLWKQNIS